ncbi:MAG: NUDIX hydrolase [Candidatus Eremiobacteraeota bacterium]|nr:NUDIX hydrolase [Candidatus Eremiobacteraeota bacterium]
MKVVQLCSGLLIREGHVLLTRCLYEGEKEPLWTLPGGRQEKDETKPQTVTREFWEETSLRVGVGGLAYASESIDTQRGQHVLNATFFVEEVDPSAAPRSQDPSVVEVRFVAIADAPALLRADVLRIPVQAALSGELNGCYFSFRADQVAEPFFRSPLGSPD